MFDYLAFNGATGKAELSSGGQTSSTQVRFAKADGW